MVGVVRKTGLWFLVLGAVLAGVAARPSSSGGPQEDVVTEEVLLRPLPDGRIAAHFHMHQHHSLSLGNPTTFPKAILELVAATDVRQFDLSFGKGRWRGEAWGRPPLAAQPTGAALAASFAPAPNATADHSQSEAQWAALAHGLSAIFCASLNFLEGRLSTAAPLSSPLDGSPQDATFRYGALPREGLCTENLTPWLSLLPCRDVAGLGLLLQDRARLLAALYQSATVQVKVLAEGGVALEQTLTLVLEPEGEPKFEGLPLTDWSTASLFNRSLQGPCHLAASSHLYIEVDGGMLSAVPGGAMEEASISINDNQAYKMKPTPTSVVERGGGGAGEGAVHGGTTLADWPLHRFQDLDVKMTWRTPLSWTPTQSSVQVNQYLTGRGQAHGGVVIDVQRIFPPAGLGGAGAPLDLHLFQTTPWFMRIFWHTLRLTVDDQPVPVVWGSGPVGAAAGLGEEARPGAWGRFRPAQDRAAGGLLELRLRLPPAAAAASLTLRFEKAFLRITDFPPDANHGFEVEAVVAAALPGPAAADPGPWSDTSAFPPASALDEIDIRPLLRRLQETRVQQTCTEGLVLVLPAPDFSMPYNVVTFTSTAVALAFGSIFGLLLRRSEALVPDPAAPDPRDQAGAPAGFMARLKKRIFGSGKVKGE